MTYTVASGAQRVVVTTWDPRTHEITTTEGLRNDGFKSVLRHTPEPLNLAMADVKVSEDGKRVVVSAGTAYTMSAYGNGDVQPEELTPQEAEALARRLLTAARAARPGYQPKKFGDH